MKYKINDRVRVKSLDWYNANKDEYGVVLVENGDYMFCKSDIEWCGKIVTIAEVCLNEYYRIVEDFNKYRWTDEMIEGLVDEETKPIDFTIKATDTKGKVEVVIPEGYGYVVENDKLYFIKKKKEYPKTYEECCNVLDDNDRMSLRLMNEFKKLINARNAYWKIYGEEMGLRKPWEPDWKDDEQFKYIIICRRGCIIKDTYTAKDVILAFPTEEMRDAFYDNFKEEIEECKELL